MEGQQLCVCAAAHAHAVNPHPNERRAGIALMAMASPETVICLHVSHLVQPWKGRSSPQGQLPLQYCFVLSRSVSSHPPTRPVRTCEIDWTTPACSSVLCSLPIEMMPERAPHPKRDGQRSGSTGLHCFTQSHYSGTRTIASPNASSRKPSPLASSPDPDECFGTRHELTLVAKRLTAALVSCFDSCCMFTHLTPNCTCP